MSDFVNILNPELRSRIKRDYPGVPGAWVEFFDDTTAGAVLKAESSQTSGDVSSGLELVLSQIADWNFADTKGNKLPLTMEGLGRLPVSIVSWLSNQQVQILKEANHDAKKNLSPAG